MSIRVFLADDQALVRAGFAMVVRSQPDMRVVGEAGDGASALRMLAATAADVVLMDVRMPGVGGLEATRRLLDRSAAPKVIVLTTYDLDEYAFPALRAGASGFLVKDAEPEDLLAAVRTVHRGDAVVAPSTTRRLLDHIAAELPSPTGPDPAAALSERERQVLIEIGLGRTNGEISARLHLAPGTVKTHVGRVLAKLGLRDRVHAVIFCYEHRLVRP